MALGVLVLAAAWAILFPNCETERTLTEQCSACFASRRSAESGFWFFGSRVVEGTTTVEVRPGPEPDVAALLGEGHTHQWSFAGMAYSCMGIATGFACGGGGFNPVALAVGRSPLNRSRVRELVESGDFRRDEVVAILELPRVPTVKDRQDPARQHLFRRGQDLLRSGGWEQAGAWPGATETDHPADCFCRRIRR